ncbi:MAG: hypothetical protein J3K34DRAFT_527471 [Monoraphidium minutum]|nr:MAG: hypothetical protein J3K34DRAFT_527471 [Monoraphidium minutum]
MNWMTGFGIRYGDALSLEIRLEAEPASLELFKDEGAHHTTKMRVRHGDAFLRVKVNGEDADGLMHSGTMAEGLPEGLLVYFPPRHAVNPDDATDGPLVVVRTPSAEFTVLKETEDALHLDVKIAFVGKMAATGGLLGQTVGWRQSKPEGKVKDGILVSDGAEFEVKDGLAGTTFEANLFRSGGTAATGAASALRRAHRALINVGRPLSVVGLNAASTGALRNAC